LSRRVTAYPQEGTTVMASVQAQAVNRYWLEVATTAAERRAVRYGSRHRAMIARLPGSQCPQWRRLVCTRRGVCRFRPSRRRHGCSPGWRCRCVVLIKNNAAGQAQHIVANYRPRGSLLLLARLLGEEFAGTPYAEYFATGDS